MRARAALGVGLDSAGRAVVTTLHSDPPLVLRPTIRTGDYGPAPRSDPRRTVRVAVAAGAGGPVGGDDLELTVRIGPGATLVLLTVAASVVLPGPRGERSRMRVCAEVASGGTLVWLPEPLVAAAGCDHDAGTSVALGTGARLLLREELILGRHGELPGRVRQRLRVTRAGSPHHHQELVVGPGEPGWDGAAVTGGRKAVGSLLAVGWEAVTPPAGARAGAPAGQDPDCAVLELAHGGKSVVAVAADSHTLRTRLDDALSTVCPTGGGPTSAARTA